MSIAESIQSIGFLTQLRESALVYPIIMTTHLSCIAIFGGLILMTDMRLLGLALRSRSVTDVVGQFRIWKRIGFCVMITMGVLLASCEAEKYTPNPYFWAKMSLLVLVGVHAAIFRKSVYNSTEEIDRAPAIPARAKLAGASSLILWLSILSMGRLIGYWEPPKVTQASPTVTATAHVPR
ncbi:MAG: hypothetical protein C5B51_31595 [Terriglobia bacterium]|nr:MAG: hypothetical protein C5B51_31595 [Terriglobia bacterium]